MKEMEQAEIEEIGNASTLVRWGITCGVSIRMATREATTR